MTLNLNTLLAVLGGLGVFVPGIDSISAGLTSLHLAWLGTVIKGLGLLAAFCSSAPLAVPYLRKFLSLLGLATAPGAQAPWDPARDGKITPIEDPRPRSSGPKAAAVLILGASMLLAGAARAQTYGGCFDAGQLCAGPSAAITVVSFNLANSTFQGGVSPGIGYGLTWTPPSAPWAAVGLDLYASVKLGQSVPNQASFSLMAHAFNYIFLGIGPTITQEPAGLPALVQWSILGGFGVPLDLASNQIRSAGGK